MHCRKTHSEKSRARCGNVKNALRQKGEKNAYKTQASSTFHAKLTNFCCKHLNANKQFMATLILWFSVVSEWECVCVCCFLRSLLWYVVASVADFLYLRVVSHFCGFVELQNELPLCSCLDAYDYPSASECWNGFDAIFKSMQWIQWDDTYNVGGSVGYKTTSARLLLKIQLGFSMMWASEWEREGPSDEYLSRISEEKPLDKWPLYNYLISMTLASEFHSSWAIFITSPVVTTLQRRQPGECGLWEWYCNNGPYFERLLLLLAWW